MGHLNAQNGVEENLEEKIPPLAVREGASKVKRPHNRQWLSKRVMRLTLASATLLSGLCFFAAGLSYWIFAASQTRDHGAMLEIISNSTPPPLVEQRASREYLTGCVDVLSHWTFALKPTSARIRLSEKCFSFAIQQAKWDADTSEGALVRAYGDWHTGAHQDALVQLKISRKLAPRDLWTAVHRLELLLKLVPEEALINHSEEFASEFRLLTETNRGIQTAVELYLRYNGLRPVLLSIAEDMKADDRHRFLNSIKRRMKG